MAAGVRSGLAPWIGGASSPAFTPAPVVQGVRSMFAFWMGGANSPRFTPAPAVAAIHGGDDEKTFDIGLDMRKRRDDQEIMAVIQKFVRTVH